MAVFAVEEAFSTFVTIGNVIPFNARLPLP